MTIERPACSFCGREQADALQLVAGPGVAICADDVARAGREGRLRDGKCSFCARTEERAAWFYGDDPTICDACVELCRAIIADERMPAVDVGPAEGLRHSTEELYAREVWRHPIVDPLHEARLWDAVLAARDAGHRLLSEHDLPLAEHARLEGLVRRGDEAKATLLRSYLRLVVVVARRARSSSVPLLDRVQEGNVGLLRAVDTFDPARHGSFAPYATHVVRVAIERADENRRALDPSVRLPTHVEQLLARVSRVKEDLISRLARRPTDDEIADAAGLPVARVRELQGMERVLTRGGVEGSTPRCSGCGGFLGRTVRVRALDVPAADDGPTLRVLVLFCGACGRTVGTDILPSE